MPELQQLTHCYCFFLSSSLHFILPAFTSNPALSHPHVSPSFSLSLFQVTVKHLHNGNDTTWTWCQFLFPTDSCQAKSGLLYSSLRIKSETILHKSHNLRMTGRSSIPWIPNASQSVSLQFPGKVTKLYTSLVTLTSVRENRGIMLNFLMTTNKQTKRLFVSLPST